jgi:hypothetical protein
MAWYDRVLEWAEPYIDSAAEFINYEDIDYGIGTLSAGDQLVDDVSDAFGFIKQGAKAYGTMTGLGEKGKPNNVFKQATYANNRKTRSVKDLTRGGSQVYQASNTSGQTSGSIGANNPYIQSAMASLMGNPSYNSQMNNLISNFAVSPTIRQGRSVAHGSSKLPKRTKKATV